MGCIASNLNNDDTVRRCRERHRFMKEAVCARHHLAAAHADYFRSLRITASALSLFAAGEPLSISDQTPAVFLQTSPPHSSDIPVPPRVPSPSPPPPPAFSPPASSISSSVSQRRKQQQQRRRKPPPKLPHILSGSSLCNSPRSHKSNLFGAYPHSTFSSTPSQASSSVWNWENFYPPSPPDSEFFQIRTEAQAHTRIQTQNLNRQREFHNLDEESEPSEYDFFLKKSENQNDTEIEREEVQCSEWEGHYSISSSSDGEGENEERDLRSEIGSRSNYEPSVRGARSVGTDSVAPPPPTRYPSKAEKFEEWGSSAGSYRPGEILDMKMVIRHKDLKEIVDAIKEYFEKAAAAGDGVSELLEIGRAQLDRNFSQLKRTVYHSNSVLSYFSSSLTSKPPLAVKYRLDTSLNEPGGPKSLCSTLDRLLAWEKKLYAEVKAREGVKMEHQKKLSTLQSQEYRGEGETKLDKTKASIKRLQSLIIVTSQAVTTTSTAINGLRDSDLVPQLVALCHGFMYMWRSMHQYHDIQNNIIQQVCGLVNTSTTKANQSSTSKLHFQATRDLESAVATWHSSFSRLIKFQRDFIRSLHGWFHLSLLPVNNNSLNKSELWDDVYAFFDEWKLALDRVPDTVASEAIKSFVNVVHVISIKQSEELKAKKRTDTISKELEKKASSVRNIERKFYNSYSMVGIALPDNGYNDGPVLDVRDPLVEKKYELTMCQRRVEDEMAKHSKAVEVTRASTLNNIQTGLPGVFQALTSFSSLFMEELESVCTRSYAIK